MWNIINALAKKEYGNTHTIGNKFYVIGNSELPDFGGNNRLTVEWRIINSLFCLQNR